MKSLLCAMYLTLGLCSISFAGNEMGNGTDNESQIERTAWFVGKTRTIRACLVTAPDFSVSEPLLAEKIKNAFQKWPDYIKEKFSGRFLQDTASDLVFATKLELISKCDNSEDLKFYFGIEDKEVIKGKKKYTNPTAFAKKITFDSSTGWSKGYIWVAKDKSIRVPLFPNWQNPGDLDAILLHEFGHIFGVDHIADTIMDKSLSAQLDQKERNISRTEIDGKKELWFCTGCKIQYSGLLGVGAGADEDRIVFERMTGIRSAGPFSGRLEGASLYKDLKLIISDGNRQFEFPVSIPFQMYPPIFHMEGSIFTIAKGSASSVAIPAGSVNFGMIQMLDGAKNNIVIEINASNEDSIGPVKLKEIRNGTARTIFRAQIKR